jgi:hypothetical protein
VATSDLKCRPNAAPKMLLNIDKEFIYLVDYTIGTTRENLKVNPRISLSFSDADELKGYQINGRLVRILEGSDISPDVMKRLDERKMDLSIERVISGVRNAKPHKVFEIEIKKNFVIYKIKIEEIVEISPLGDIQRKDVPSRNNKNSST